jgi:hypothetical protein
MISKQGISCCWKKKRMNVKSVRGIRKLNLTKMGKCMGHVLGELSYI